jgi:hypothetical protein
MVKSSYATRVALIMGLSAIPRILAGMAPHIPPALHINLQRELQTKCIQHYCAILRALGVPFRPQGSFAEIQSDYFYLLSQRPELREQYFSRLLRPPVRQP